MTVVDFLIVLVVTLRITRLIVKDVITQPVRDTVIRISGENGKLTELVHCPWCFGFWVALVSGFGVHFIGHDWAVQAFAIACAASWLTGIATSWLDE